MLAKLFFIKASHARPTLPLIHILELSQGCCNTPSAALSPWRNSQWSETALTTAQQYLGLPYPFHHRGEGIKLFIPFLCHQQNQSRLTTSLLIRPLQSLQDRSFWVPSVVSALLLFFYTFSGTGRIFLVTSWKNCISPNYTHLLEEKKKQKTTRALSFGRENKKRGYEAGWNGLFLPCRW